VVLQRRRVQMIVAILIWILIVGRWRGRNGSVMP
jgi:hypothetical protein